MLWPLGNLDFFVHKNVDSGLIKQPFLKAGSLNLFMFGALSYWSLVGVVAPHMETTTVPKRVAELIGGLMGVIDCNKN